VLDFMPTRIDQPPNHILVDLPGLSRSMQEAVRAKSGPAEAPGAEGAKVALSMK
jgi:hypothetical protein